ncbi:ECF transporter S component [Streptococcus loxodontisalivarius]|uniref:Riboflavin transporter n=1 Tax=Streptococcus loxodontisalivarius TaxID=1349415 RepID=A0ABS2PS91_9STRE|nr:ECF transporter S component [Streptococcus loxodontisalivarius]MBM7642379.1 riboflavin transporter FmnP [Streptococcus loxodontisalivarius]
MSTATKQTRKLAYIAILSAISFLLMYFQFPLIPAASFLQVDFSILPVLLALVLMDMKSAFAVLTIRTLLKLLLNNGGASSLIGMPMNFIALGCFLLAIGLIWNKKRSTKSYIVASIVGTLALTFAMFALNYVYAVPLYAKFANFDINAILGLGNYLFAMVIPFNILEGIIFAIAFIALFAALKPILKKI